MFKNGLVLEGGGTRAIYTAGVLDAFIEKNITFPYVIGVSAGSACGASYIAKCKGRYHDITINYVNDKRYMGLDCLLKTGEFLGCEWIFGDLSYNIYPLDQDEFENSKSTLCCVLTNAKTGKPEYFYPKDLREFGCTEVRASCSLPVVTNGVEIGNELYFDGGLVDSIPLKKAIDDGCLKTVTILTQHKGYKKKPMKKSVGKLLKKYPLVANAITNRHIMYNQQLDFVKEMEEAGMTYVIQPHTPLNCSTLEKSPAKLESIYQLGYSQGLKCADEVKAFLEG